MPAYNADLAKFAALDAQVVGISPDTYFCHRAWQKKDIGMLHYPLASDFYPHGAVAEAYGVLRQGPPLPGASERAIFVIDMDGRVAWSKVYELSEQPPNEEVLGVLQKIKGATAVRQ